MLSLARPELPKKKRASEDDLTSTWASSSALGAFSPDACGVAASRNGNHAFFFQDCCRADNKAKQMFNVFVFVLAVICLGNSNDSRQIVRATAPLNRKKKAALQAPGPGAAHFCSPLPRWSNEPVE